MGNYIYYLSTQFKLVEINGKEEPVYLLKYLCRDRFDGPPKSALMTIGRCKAAWARQDRYPTYVTSNFDDPNSPIYYWGGKTDVTTNDGNWGSSYFPWVGVIEKNGRKRIGNMRTQIDLPEQFQYHQKVTDILRQDTDLRFCVYIRRDCGSVTGNLSGPAL